VRAKTSATAARMQSDPRQSVALQQSAQDYLALAERLLHPSEPCVVAIGGFSGSGKSTLARGLAPSVGGVPGAVVIRSDEVRKRLAGVSPLDRLGDEGYTRTASREVYATAARLADVIVRSGHGVVVDAVFSDRADRDAIEHVATAASVPFVGLWLEAPWAALAERVRSRKHDASDATPEIVREQLNRGAGQVTWRQIDATLPVDALVQRALERVPLTSRLDGFPHGHENRTRSWAE